jgi:hypothetical protein
MAALERSKTSGRTKKYLCRRVVPALEQLGRLGEPKIFVPAGSSRSGTARAPGRTKNICAGG